jgi:hypothetical protein
MAMAEVLAGFVCGYALALIAAPILAIALVRLRTGSEYLAQVVPVGTNVLALSVVLFGFAFIALTAVGMVLGMMLAGLEDSRPGSGLGSPNGLFTGLVLVMAAIAVAPLAVALPRWRRPLAASGGVFVLIFGWAMPWLSLAGPEG